MVAVPVAGLAGRLETADSFSAMARTYPDAFVSSVLLAGAGGLLAVWSGFATMQSGAFGRAIAIVLLAAGILPGALMGKALAVTYVGVPAIYDHWPIVVLAYAGRYGWIGVAVGWFARHTSANEIEAMARVDGAGSPEVFWWLRLGTAWPALLAAWLVATGMGLTDLATAPQVAPPQFGLLSVILVEKFHRFEEQMLVCISLTMLALPIVAAMLMGFLARRVLRAQ
jgi:ABC-type Fe3+ transport system permease subunit